MNIPFVSALLFFISAFPFITQAKNCTKGIPCGDTCISANYTCNIGNPTTPAAPASPSEVSATVVGTGQQINLAWSAISGATSYKVYRNGTLLTVTNQPSYSQTGLQALTSYIYTVTACTSSGTCSEQSAPTSITTPAMNYSGLFYNPNESGWGMSVTHHVSPSNIIFASWYAYDALGKPIWYVISSCQVSADACSGDIYKTTGTPFGQAWDASKLGVTKVGQGSLSFADQNNATFRYVIDGVSGMKSVTQQLFASGTTIPTVTYTDIWYNQNEPGWGVSITHQYGVSFVAWYTYDGTGKPTWYVASACAMATDNKSCRGDVYQTTGTYFNSGWNSTNSTVNKVGTLTITFNDVNSGVMTYLINGITESRILTRQSF